jgi:hypothetical protein
MDGWDPVHVASLWQNVNTCPTAKAETESSFSKSKNWAVPLIIVVIVLIIALIVVLFYKQKSRLRSYTKELGLPELSPVSPTTQGEGAGAIESQVLATSQPAKAAEPTYDQVPTSEETGPSSGSSHLPAGWSKLTDPNNGQQYYYNSTTGVSQWEAPDA